MVAIAGSWSRTSSGATGRSMTVPAGVRAASGDSTRPVRAASCPGDALLCEDFEDTNFADRGWYDEPRGVLSSDEHAPGSNYSLQCTYLKGERVCEGGTPARHLFAPTDQIYFEFWVKYGAGFVEWSVRIVGAAPGPDSVPVRDAIASERVAVLVGSEHPGLSSGALALCDERVRVPMAPGVDSLNVGVAAAVVLDHLSYFVGMAM